MSNTTPTLFDDLFGPEPSEETKKQKPNKKKEKKAAEPSAAAMSLFGELEIFDKNDMATSDEAIHNNTTVSNPPSDKIEESISDLDIREHNIHEDAKSLLDKQLFSELYQDFFAADAILGGKESIEENSTAFDNDNDAKDIPSDNIVTQEHEVIESIEAIEENTNQATLLGTNPASVIPINTEKDIEAPSNLDTDIHPIEDPYQIELPEWHLDKNYYTIGMVAKMFEVNISHIRFWTNEFNLKPRTNRKGDRLYTPALINTLRLIHYLVKVQKHTIKGAKEKLAGRKKAINANLTLKDQLLALKNQLTSLRNNID